MAIRFEVLTAGDTTPPPPPPVQATLEVDADGDLRLRLNGKTILYIGNDGQLWKWSLPRRDQDALPGIQFDGGGGIREGGS